MTPETVQKLREVFLLDYSIEEACDHAKIAKQTYYNECKRNPAFMDEMERSQRGLAKAAKRVVAKEILVKENARIAFDYLKSRQPERYNRRIDDEDAVPVGLPAGSTIILPGSKPHPRILPEL